MWTDSYFALLRVVHRLAAGLVAGISARSSFWMGLSSIALIFNVTEAVFSTTARWFAFRIDPRFWRRVLCFWMRLFHYLYRFAMGIFAPSLRSVNLAPVFHGMVVGCVVVSVHEAVETFDAKLLLDISVIANGTLQGSNPQQCPRPWSQKVRTGDVLVADGWALGLVEARRVYGLRPSTLPWWGRIS